MKKIMFALPLLLLGCISDNSEPNYKSTSQASHAWSTYHWTRTTPQLSLKLGNNLTPGWVPYLNTASSDWNVSTVLETTVVPGSSTKQCKPVLGRVEVCNSTYGKNGWLGIAQIWISSGHIVQATVKMNDSYFNTAKYNTVAYKHLVVCQEVGHTFGLDHQDETQTNANLGTCMDYTTNPAGPLSNEHPNAHDYEELEEIYDHLEAPVAIQAFVSEPNQLGKLRSASNNSESFVLDLGNNQSIVTHVLGAD